MELGPSPEEAPAQVLYGGAGQFQAGGELAGSGAAITKEFEELQKHRVSTEEGREGEFELVESDERFLIEQDDIGRRGWFRDQLNDADGFAVIEGDGSEIGLTAEEPSFGAVMQAVDVPADAAFEVPLNFLHCEVV